MTQAGAPLGADANSGIRVAMTQFSQGKPMHAYLLSGARGVGKRSLATRLLCALRCEAEPKPCLACDACRRVLAQNDPDVSWLLSPEKAIGVEQVRDTLERVGQHAFGGGTRAVVVEPAEAMTPQAQNALLKSLEEPPADVVFLLLSHEPSMLLPTIRSRCSQIKLTAWTDERLSRVLLERGYAEQRVRAAVAAAGGNIGQALALLEPSEQDAKAREWVQSALGIVSDADAVRLSTQLKDERDGAARFLLGLEQALRRVLLAATGCADPSALWDLPPVWKRAAQARDAAGVTRLVQAVFAARRARAGQVNWQSTVDRLMLRILEEVTKWRQLSE